ANRYHGDDGTYAEDDAKHGERRTQLVALERAQGYAHRHTEEFEVHKSRRQVTGNRDKDSYLLLSHHSSLVTRHVFYTRSLLGKQESNRDQIGPTSQAPRLVSSPCACHRGTDRFFCNPLGSLRLHAIIRHYG